MSTVIARSRQRMFTAFVTDDGRHVLNIALRVDGAQRCVSIEVGEADARALAQGDEGVVERVVADGRRIEPALPTPSAGEPVAGFSRAA